MLCNLTCRKQPCCKAEILQRWRGLAWVDGCPPLGWVGWISNTRTRLNENFGTPRCHVFKYKDWIGLDWIGCDSRGQFFHASCPGCARRRLHNISPAVRAASCQRSRVKILKLTLTLNQMMNLTSCIDFYLPR